MTVQVLIPRQWTKRDLLASQEVHHHLREGARARIGRLDDLTVALDCPALCAAHYRRFRLDLERRYGLLPVYKIKQGCDYCGQRDVDGTVIMFVHEARYRVIRGMPRTG